MKHSSAENWSDLKQAALERVMDDLAKGRPQAIIRDNITENNRLLRTLRSKTKAKPEVA